jgi:hypothetical protein
MLNISFFLLFFLQLSNSKQGNSIQILLNITFALNEGQHSLFLRFVVSLSPPSLSFFSRNLTLFFFLSIQTMRPLVALVLFVLLLGSTLSQQVLVTKREISGEQRAGSLFLFFVFLCSLSFNPLSRLFQACVVLCTNLLTVLSDG